jgi:hypothetical protein
MLGPLGEETAEGAGGGILGLVHLILRQEVKWQTQAPQRLNVTLKCTQGGTPQDMEVARRAEVFTWGPSIELQG